ncbi:peptide ABC transporter substrate-binding protein [Enteroscipio rubneri]|uniref:Peptide ABC transporter substrate-binding protein n=1 Tax=Enteroscipio rubneri TaxID=2070686 RepID=A0A2K2UAF3_9ACTN|nr:peptide ABC transporter substrate-binding protein [Enteroscipio rubneri]PNV67160.1 peptide ABC transporter substrate-binding protein [Enteroscipio rubneri]
MEGFAPITGEEHELLVAKCQENGWLKRGGYDWQDDPFMEEYPYEFSKAESIEGLRNAFARGNWAIRQGFVYEDLAFIQQVNGGDEWWTCKRFDGEWIDFESWSFGRISLDPAEFEDAMLHMRHATKEECTSLRYMDSKIPERPQSLADRAQGAIQASATLDSATQHRQGPNHTR